MLSDLAHMKSWVLLTSLEEKKRPETGGGHDGKEDAGEAHFQTIMKE